MQNRLKSKLCFFFAVAVSLCVHAEEVVLPTLEIRSETYSEAYTKRLTKEEIALRLGWVSDNTVDNYCHGYYLEPVLFYEDHLDLPADKRPIRVSFEDSDVSSDGLSIFSGNVIITQPNRQLLADVTHLHRDEGTNSFSEADLFGNIEWREPGKHLIGERGHITFDMNSGYLTDVIYRLTYKQLTDEDYLDLISDKQEILIDSLTAWGTARQLHRYGDGVIEVVNATYSLCPPTDSTWRLKARKFQLDNRIGKGKAQDVTFYIYKVPVLYTPYFQFPLDKRRKTGFLFPAFGMTTTGGYEAEIPFYWNIAPNFDMTITPHYMSDRGMQMNGQFRYLTENSFGNLHGSILPNDSEFADFRKRNLEKFPEGTPSRSRLDDATDTRSFISFKDNHQYNYNWNSYLYLNHVSDDYYFIDFKDDPAQITENQIINEARLNYAGEHWAFATNLLAYQTLHPINQAPVNNQYQKLPEMVLNGHYPYVWDLFDFRFNNSAVYFNKISNPGMNFDPVTGSRIEVNPIVALPMYWVSGYFNPQIQLSMTQYDLNNQTPGDRSSITRITPIANVDTGLIFERDTHLFGETYRQTLEPRLFYLYVPVRNQNEIPLFDTSLQPFTYSQLFRTNRFTGLDRISDANQVTLALSSRLLSAESGEEKLRASIGEIFYFKDRQVNIKPNMDPDIVTRVITLPDDTSVSPVVGELKYRLQPNWRMYSLATWDPNTNILNNASFSTQYKRDNRHIVNVGINYLRGGDPEKYADPLSSQNDLYQPEFSFVWPINRRITTLGHWNYNVSHGYTQTAFAGFQYDSCCWAFRLIGGREFLYQKIPVGSLPRPVFDTRVFFEIVFKGLGKLSQDNAHKLLKQHVAGFKETLSPFAEH